MLMDKHLIIKRSSSSKQPNLNFRFIHRENMARLHCKDPLAVAVDKTILLSCSENTQQLNTHCR